MFKKFLAILLSLILLAQTIPVFGEEVFLGNLVILGDSISTGYGLCILQNNSDDNKYSDNNFSVKLANKLELKPLNFAADGTTSSELLQILLSEDNILVKESIKNAKAISITVGKDNLLDVLNASVYDLLTIGGGLLKSPISALEVIMSKQESKEALISEIKKAVSEFTGKNGIDGDFGRIIMELKRLNPKAPILVQTIYNPFDFLEEISKELEPHIQTMNSVIRTGAFEGAYELIDTYRIYKERKEPYANLTEPSFYGFIPYLNIAAHEAIYSEIVHSILTEKPVIEPPVPTEEARAVVSSHQELEQEKKYKEEAKETEEVLHSFTDIKGHWAEQYIALAYEFEIVKDSENNLFQPDKTLTMKEFLELLSVMPNFEQKIIQSTYENSTEEELNEIVTRKELAVIASISLAMLGKSPEDMSILEKFKDVSELNQDYKNCIVLAAQSNVMIGTSENTFSPDAPVTKAQTITVICKLIETAILSLADSLEELSEQLS